jgi:hypothetical protein
MKVGVRVFGHVVVEDDVHPLDVHPLEISGVRPSNSFTASRRHFRIFSSILRKRIVGVGGKQNRYNRSVVVICYRTLQGTVRSANWKGYGSGVAFHFIPFRQNSLVYQKPTNGCWRYKYHIRTTLTLTLA